MKGRDKMSKKKLVFNVLAPVIGGSIVGYLANKNARLQYDKLETPSFAPPGKVFPIIWPTLYTMMGYAHYRVAQKPATKEASEWYAAQLTLNYIWSFLFFKFNLRGTALIEMVFFLATIIMTTYEFYQHDTIAGTLMIPYIAWVSFALTLNFETWRLNR
ncbi:TspO/MBR family protein [Metalysinibacillus saudimassiliensis]|uniref:TspO/MBR family protein n=1 Tax=Metalysinibacillus saudimassiliensis TaxID=1461583 RepID=A0A078MHB1_9BACL|nr:TspO/MBR family protein [Metalysinibacillus saudimassiliensis]